MQKTVKPLRLNANELDMISRSWEDAGRKVQSRSQSGTVKKSGICWEDFAIGALVGIGAYMLLKALTEED